MLTVLVVMLACALVVWRIDERSRRRVRTAEARFEMSFENAPTGMAVVGRDGTLLEVNAALCALVGRDAAELRGTAVSGLGHTGEPGFEARRRFAHADGREVWADLRVSPVRDGRGATQHLILQAEDVTERRVAEAELRFLADHDGLTGLLNRRRFEEELGAAARLGDETALLVLDIDHFKEINDTFGHAAGDAVLRGVADILRERTRSSDVVARLGGDEFALLLMRAAAEQAEAVAADIATAVRGWHDFDGDLPVAPTTSIGVALLNTAPGEDPGLALRRADAAMYAAKAAGRDGLVVAAA